MCRSVSVSVILTMFLTAICWIAPVAAHHSFFADFGSKMGTVEGEVVDVYYKNPHTHFYVKVLNEDGNEEIWNAVGQNVRRMMRFGWKRNSVKVGDKLKIMGNLGLDNTKNIAIVVAQKDDGTDLSLSSGSTAGYVDAFTESQVRQKDEK